MSLHSPDSQATEFDQTCVYCRLCHPSKTNYLRDWKSCQVKKTLACLCDLGEMSGITTSPDHCWKLAEAASQVSVRKYTLFLSPPQPPVWPLQLACLKLPTLTTSPCLTLHCLSLAKVSYNYL